MEVDMKRFSKRDAIKIVSILIFLGAIISSVYFFYQYKKAQDLLLNPQAAAQTDVQQLISKVGKLIDLPKEQPTVATISDISKLKGQAFFARAQDGDKVLLYTKSKKAYLYRPADNKLIEVAPLTVGDQQQNQQTQQGKVAGASTQVTPTASISPVLVVSPTKKPTPYVTGTLRPYPTWTPIPQPSPTSHP